MNTPLLKDHAARIETMIDLGPGDDATAPMAPVIKNTFNLRKLNLNLRFKSYRLPGRMLIIPDGDPAYALTGLQEQTPQPKAKTTTLAGDTSKVVPPEQDERERAKSRHIHDLGSFNLNPGGAGGQGEQVQKDQVAVKRGAEDNTTAVGLHTVYGRAKSEATKVSTISVSIPGVRSTSGNLSGCSPVLPKAGLDLFLFEVDERKRTMTKDIHELGETGGQGDQDQVVEVPHERT